MSVTVEGSYAVQNTWNTYLEGTFDSISGTGVVTVATSNDGNAIVDLDRDVVVFFPGGKTPNNASS